jgi:prepilin-type N-terminal cleavage/methylation domain-containing protein
MLQTPRTYRGRESGLTLIEILISMIILGIITTFLVIGWINMQRGTAFAISSNNARSIARDTISRVATELRGAQPTILPSPSVSATAMPTGQPPIVTATTWDIVFYSAFNNGAAASDPTGVGALRKTEMKLDTTSSGLDTAHGILYLYRDLNGDGTTNGTGDLKIVLAKNVINKSLYDPLSGNPTEQLKYALFSYGYRTLATDPVVWTATGTSVLTSIVAVRSRVIIDANIAHTPKFIDTTTTVRLRNASGS